MKYFKNDYVVIWGYSKYTRKHMSKSKLFDILYQIKFGGITIEKTLETRRVN